MRKKGKAMPLKQSTLVQFKEGVGDLLPSAPGFEPDAPFNYLVLEVRDRRDRILWPGYPRSLRSDIPGELPFLGSSVKVVAFVPEARRAELSGVVPGRALAAGEEGYYGGDVVLMYASRALPFWFRNARIPFKREAVRQLLQEDLEKIDRLGSLPVTMEDVPDLVGCLPEFTHPSTDAFLLRCLEKIRSSSVCAF